MGKAKAKAKSVKSVKSGQFESRTIPAEQPAKPGYIAESLWPLLVPVDSLVEDDHNARKHGNRNLDAIRKSLAGFRQQKPIVASDDGKVIAGNGTLRAAKALGWEWIAASRFDGDAQSARAYAVADNQTAITSDWDDTILAEVLGDIDDELRGWLGFADDEFEKILGATFSGNAGVEGADPDAVPAPAPAAPDEATTRPGDLWILGEHRLLCGDAGNAADLDRLLDGEPVHLVNTDPPYNVKVESRSNNAIAAGLSSFTNTYHQRSDLARNPKSAQATHRQLRPKDRPLANDFISDEKFEQLLRAWFGNAARVLLPGRGFYIWGGYVNCANYPPVLKESGLYFSQVIVWAKGHPVLTRKDFMCDHEGCFYGWKEGAAHYFNPEIHNATDVWSIKKVNPTQMIHLTEKPVELAERAIGYSSRPGENVLDLFGGSGSTLIAAERTGRRAFLMELDELYCDVIVRRWEEYTGKKATLAVAQSEQEREARADVF